MMNISLSRRYALNHEELLVCVSVFTSLSSFSSITEIGNRSVKASLHPSQFHRSAVESAYKSPFYKIWQDWIKNKSLKHNNSAIHSRSKKGSHVKQVATSYQSYPEKITAVENHMAHSVLVHKQKSRWFRNPLFFCNRNSHGVRWTGIYGFILHVCTVKNMLGCVKNILQNNGIYICKKQSLKLNDFISRIYSNTIWQDLRKSKSTDIYTDKFFTYEVFCS